MLLHGLIIKKLLFELYFLPLYLLLRILRIPFIFIFIYFIFSILLLILLFVLFLNKFNKNEKEKYVRKVNAPSSVLPVQFVPTAHEKMSCPHMVISWAVSEITP